MAMHAPATPRSGMGAVGGAALRHPPPKDGSLPTSGDGPHGEVDVIRTPRRAPNCNAYVERLIGSIRRECTDHVSPIGEKHLLRLLREYAAYFNESRTHYSLDGNSPVERPVEQSGDVVGTPVLGGLHHRYSRVE